MDEDLFDQMLKALHQSDTPETPTQTNTGWQPDGTYKKKPLDPNYFSKYYQQKLKNPFNCPDCGRTISSKSCDGGVFFFHSFENVLDRTEDFGGVIVDVKLLKEITPCKLRANYERIVLRLYFDDWPHSLQEDV